MGDVGDRRAFPRHHIEFDIEITGVTPAGEPFTERTVLGNISGGGARFRTVTLERYMPGQELGLKVFLPGTDDVQAHMAGDAVVVLVDREGVAGGAAVTVKFGSTLLLEFGG